LLRPCCYVSRGWAERERDRDSNTGSSPDEAASQLSREENEVFPDESGGRLQTFTEDCTVCCRPNLITLTFDDDGDVEIKASQEYEA
jgi:hypothetical protein